MEKVNVSPSDGFSQVYDSMNDKFVQNANPIVLVMLSVIIIFYFLFLKILILNTCRKKLLKELKNLNVKILDYLRKIQSS